MRTQFRLVVGAVAAAVLLPTVGTAQGLVPMHRHKAGISGTVLTPTGEFRNFIDWGGGLSMYFVPGLDNYGTIGVRVEGGVQWYGHESYDVWLGPRVPNGFVRITTDNLIFTLGAGPQLTLGTGPVRLYGFGTAGFSYFATISSTGDTDWDVSHTNYDDVRLGLAAGGGMLIQLNRGRKPVYFDIGGQWTHNGRTRYLRSGSIVETADGGMLVFPIYSDADFWTWRLGVAFGF